mmetsp:Transcript_9456/g.57703  ORF Transcript_9456/g.57703 Transcript_9456/m.57703 type:complete len:734 (-) Transcript_9456:1169-3370(-)
MMAKHSSPSCDLWMIAEEIPTSFRDHRSIAFVASCTEDVVRTHASSSVVLHLRRIVSSSSSVSGTRRGMPRTKDSSHTRGPFTSNSNAVFEGPWRTCHRRQDPPPTCVCWNRCAGVEVGSSRNRGMTWTSSTRTRCGSKMKRAAKNGKQQRRIKARAAEDPMRIVFVSMECSPWSKTGGMGDVVGALPIALSERGHHVMSVVPMYNQYNGLVDTQLTSMLYWNSSEVQTNLTEAEKNARQVEVQYFYAWEKGVHRVFVDNPCFRVEFLPTAENPEGFTREKLYGYSPSTEYPDNDLRMSLLCQAAIEVARTLQLETIGGEPLGEKVIFVCNDWHTALLPLQLKYVHHTKEQFLGSRVAFCLHNAAYQGRFPLTHFPRLNLPDAALPSLLWNSSSSNGCSCTMLNWLKAALVESDLLLTVSNGYALEVASSPQKGFELDHEIRLCGGLHGIVNGIDAAEWNPCDDEFLDDKGRYSLFNAVEGKLHNKSQVQEEYGLQVNPYAPLMAFIGRLDQQKGVDLLLDALPEILKRQDTAQFIALGSGNCCLENRLSELSSQFPGRAIGLAQFCTKKAHKINAAADYMIVPSRFEPCGLVQLHAMAYGTIPIVAPTGGLLDTVTSTLGFQITSCTKFTERTYSSATVTQMNTLDCVNGLAESSVSHLLTDEDTDNLLTSIENQSTDKIDSKAIVNTVLDALGQYNTEPFFHMREKGMETDWSWKKPAWKWEEALRTLWNK